MYVTQDDIAAPDKDRKKKTKKNTQHQKNVIL